MTEHNHHKSAVTHENPAPAAHDKDDSRRDSHQHDHGHHGHGAESHEHHGHGHSHGHGHGHGHGESGADGGHSHAHSHNDQWSGDEYLKYPGLREVAKFSHETVLYALGQAGFSDEEIKGLNVLEVGCGAGAVTQLLAGSFASVHAIDVSPSMLATFSTELPSDIYPNVTHSQHTLSPSSRGTFQSGEPVPSPTKSDPGRMVKLQTGEWDLAVVNLVLHHVDDVKGFMAGLKDLLKEGGTVVFTEFTNLPLQRTETKEGSVNAPEHYHDVYNEKSITELLRSYDWQDVYTEVRGKMSIWREDRFHNVDCLIARARKGTKEKSG